MTFHSPRITEPGIEKNYPNVVLVSPRDIIDMRSEAAIYRTFQKKDNRINTVRKDQHVKSVLINCNDITSNRSNIGTKSNNVKNLNETKNKIESVIKTYQEREKELLRINKKLIEENAALKKIIEKNVYKNNHWLSL